MIPVQAVSTDTPAEVQKPNPAEEATKECSKEVSAAPAAVTTNTTSDEQFPTFGNLPQQPITTIDEENELDKTAGDVTYATPTEPAPAQEVRELIRVREANVGVPQFGTTFTGTAATKRIVRVTTVNFDEGEETRTETAEITAERSTSVPTQKTYSRQRTIVGAPTRTDPLSRSMPTLKSLRSMGTTTFENPGTNQSAFIVRGGTVTLPPAGMPMSTVLNTATFEEATPEEDDAQTMRTATPRSPVAPIPDREELKGWGKKPWNKTPKTGTDDLEGQPGRGRRILSAGKSFFLRKFSSKNSFESAAEEPDDIAQDDLQEDIAPRDLQADIDVARAASAQQNDIAEGLDKSVDISAIEVLEEVTAQEIVDSDEVEPVLQLLATPVKPRDAEKEEKNEESGEKNEAEPTHEEKENQIVDELVEDILRQVVSEEVQNLNKSGADAEEKPDVQEGGEVEASNEEEKTEQQQEKVTSFIAVSEEGVEVVLEPVVPPKIGLFKKLSQRSGSLRNLLRKKKPVEAPKQVEEANTGTEIVEAELKATEPIEVKPEEQDVPATDAAEPEGEKPQLRSQVTNDMFEGYVAVVDSPVKAVSTGFLKVPTNRDLGSIRIPADPEDDDVAAEPAQSPVKSVKAGSVGEGSVVNELDGSVVAESPNTKWSFWRMLQRKPTWARTPDASMVQDDLAAESAAALAQIHSVQEAGEQPNITVTAAEGGEASANPEAMEVVVEVDGQEIVLLTSNDADGQVAEVEIQPQEEGDKVPDDAYVGYVGIAPIENEEDGEEKKDAAEELVNDLLDESDVDSLALEVERKEKQQASAVTRLQVAFRKQRTFKMEKNAATKLQSAFRRSQSFKTVQTLREENAQIDRQQQAAVTIQAKWKRKKTMDLEKTEKNAALVIQTTWRNKRTGSIIKEEEQEIEVEQVKPEMTAALAIQTAWRQRQHTKELAMDEEKTEKINVQVKLRRKDLPISKPIWALTPSQSERAPPSIAASLERERLNEVEAETEMEESMKRTENVVTSMIDEASADDLQKMTLPLSPPAKMSETDEWVMVSPAKSENKSFPIFYTNGPTVHFYFYVNLTSTSRITFYLSIFCVEHFSTEY